MNQVRFYDTTLWHGTQGEDVSFQLQVISALVFNVIDVNIPSTGRETLVEKA